VTVVIVKPDDLSAWTGLAGVVVGAVLTAGLDWWRNGRGERRRRRLQLIVAGTELQRRATALEADIEFSKTAVAAGEPTLAWIEYKAKREDALYEAAQTIIGAGSADLANAGEVVLIASRELGLNASDETAKRNLQAAIKKFAAAVHKVKP
jgi:hypothetical protein